MAAEATAQAIVRAKLWILHYQSVQHCVQTILLMSESINLFLESQIKLSNECYCQ